MKSTLQAACVATLRPQQQLFRHDPANGIHGDCYRTAVAVVLGVDAASVPHVYAHENQGTAGGMERMREWLNDRGLALFEVNFDPGCKLLNVLALSARCPGVPMIISGRSPRDINHSVVALDGTIACDPFDGTPNQNALIGPCVGSEGDTFWWAEVLTVARHHEGDAA